MGVRWMGEMGVMMDYFLVKWNFERWGRFNEAIQFFMRSTNITSCVRFDTNALLGTRWDRHLIVSVESQRWADTLPRWITLLVT
jgi:hypothetical protein